MRELFGRVTWCLACTLAAAPATPLHAGDWPQILGPHRDGVAEGEKLAATWPSDGPPTVWERRVGQGYAGVAVADGQVVLFHREKNEEVVECLAAADGSRRWRKAFPTQYAGTIADDNGPRCVPLIHDDAVYLFGVQGDLHCLARKDGAVRWSRAAYREFDASEGFFGAGSTPIVEGDKLLVNVGGKRAGLVAFDLMTGEPVWQGTDEDASYSSPAATTIDGQRTVIFVARYNVVAVDPADGSVRFSFPFGKRGPTVNAATPLVFDGLLFVSANYGVGAVLARLGPSGADELWASNDVLSSQYTTAVYHDGHLYGIDGGESIGTGTRLRCIDPLRQRVLWGEEDFGNGTLLVADGKLLALTTDGRLRLIEPSAEKLQVLAEAQVLRSTTRALPALSDGRLWVRDEQTLKCLDLR
jgi:outer membrane protein assembly factor BamB